MSRSLRRAVPLTLLVVASACSTLSGEDPGIAAPIPTLDTLGSSAETTATSDSASASANVEKPRSALPRSASSNSARSALLISVEPVSSSSGVSDCDWMPPPSRISSRRIARSRMIRA